MNKIILIDRLYRSFSVIVFAMIPIISSWAMVGLFYISIFLIVSERVLAIELSEDIQVHGFLTQGYFLTSDNNFFGTSSLGGSFNFTEAGLNASWTLNADLRLAGQVLFRHAGVGHQHDVELDFGVVDYTAFSTDDYRVGVSFGRFKIPFGLYNDTRDVIFTRPTILLPQSIYQERTRDLAISADGGIFYGEYRSNWGDLFLELGAGIPRGASLDSELAIFGFDYPGNTTSKMSYIGRLRYDIDGGKYRMAISSARVDTRYNPKFLPPDDFMALKDIFTPVIFSVQYNREKLSLTAEYAIRGIQETVNDGSLDLDISGESYYLQALYRFDRNWQAIFRYDVLYNNRDDKNGWQYQYLTGKPNYTQFAKDWTFGLRYYLNSSFLIAAEYHYVNGTAWLPLQDNPDSSILKQRWHMFSLAVGYQF
ncbi:MAG: hypothetical protein IPM89_12560 [Candidatus Competibacteraceae bacterium]|nr:MAG: hypothetical protein IPM89_12560 [Candidatus Competibacteraceae bacterium]